MRITATLLIACFVLAAAAQCILAADGSAVAQLVMVDKRVKIVKVDTKLSRLEVTETDKKNTQLYVLIDGFTKVTWQGKPIDWKSLRAGQLIRVKGGLKFDGKIRGKDIYLIKKNPT